MMKYIQRGLRIDQKIKRVNHQTPYFMLQHFHAVSITSDGRGPICVLSSLLHNLQRINLYLSLPLRRGLYGSPVYYISKFYREKERKGNLEHTLHLKVKSNRKKMDSPGVHLKSSTIRLPTEKGFRTCRLCSSSLSNDVRIS